MEKSTLRHALRNEIPQRPEGRSPWKKPKRIHNEHNSDCGNNYEGGDDNENLSNLACFSNGASLIDVSSALETHSPACVLSDTPGTRGWKSKEGLPQTLTFACNTSHKGGATVQTFGWVSDTIGLNPTEMSMWISGDGLHYKVYKVFRCDADNLGPLFRIKVDIALTPYIRLVITNIANGGEQGAVHITKLFLYREEVSVVERGSCIDFNDEAGFIESHEPVPRSALRPPTQRPQYQEVFPLAFKLDEADEQLLSPMSQSSQEEKSSEYSPKLAAREPVPGLLPNLQESLQYPSNNMEKQYSPTNSIEDLESDLSQIRLADSKLQANCCLQDVTNRQRPKSASSTDSYVCKNVVAHVTESLKSPETKQQQSSKKHFRSPTKASGNSTTNQHVITLPSKINEMTQAPMSTPCRHASQACRTLGSKLAAMEECVESVRRRSMSPTNYQYVNQSPLSTISSVSTQSGNQSCVTTQSDNQFRTSTQSHAATIHAQRASESKMNREQVKSGELLGVIRAAVEELLEVKVQKANLALEHRMKRMQLELLETKFSTASKSTRGSTSSNGTWRNAHPIATISSEQKVGLERNQLGSSCQRQQKETKQFTVSRNTRPGSGVAKVGKDHAMVRQRNCDGDPNNSIPQYYARTSESHYDRERLQLQRQRDAMSKLQKLKLLRKLKAKVQEREEKRKLLIKTLSTQPQ